VSRRRRCFPARLAFAVALGAGPALVPGSAGVAVAQLLAPPGDAPAVAPHVVARSYTAMGTDVTLSAFTTDEAAAVDAFGAAIAEIRRLEALMTDWPHEGQPPSDVLRINAAAGHEAVVVSDETFEVVSFSLDISKRSGGTFFTMSSSNFHRPRMAA